MFYQIKQYIKFIFKSTNQHGVHSPFIYNLITTCFYDKKKYQDYDKIIDFRIGLKQTNDNITVTDFGAGSHKLKSKSRRVSDIIKHVSISKKNAKLLYRINKHFASNSILELGTSLGVATHVLALSNPDAIITTIEGCPEISKYAKHNFQQLKLENIDVTTGDFLEIIPKLKHPTFDLIFFDGNHQKEATLKYFEMLIDKAHNDSVFIFDDIYWSKGMTEAWEVIKQHHKVTVTVDTFYWGIVFFRKEQLKEHFVIRT